jgi:hypothetical protein
MLEREELAEHFLTKLVDQLRNFMTVEEEKGVCKDRSKRKKVISAYPKGKRA